jgi:hypothetical protein
MTYPGTGGLPVRRIDQRTNPPAVGIQPGSQGPVVRARLVIVSGSGGGLFVYSGTPAFGNPPIAAIVAPGVTTDPYGNPVSSILNVGVLSGGHFGIGSDGTVFVSNSAGKTVIRLDTVTGSAWFYNSSGEGAGNLITSIAPAAGTDRAGNAYGAGLQIQAAGDSGQSILLTLVGGVAELQMPTGIAAEGAAANFFTGAIGAGASQAIQTGLSGPKLNVVGSTDWVQTQMNSANAGGTSSASGQFIYIDPSGGVHQVAFWDVSGWNVRGGKMVGVQPGTGTIGTPSVAEIWHVVGTAGEPVFTNTWFDVAGQAQAQFRKIGSPADEIEVTADISHLAIAGSSSPFTLPVGYRPNTQQIRALDFLVATAGYANAASPPLVTVTTGGVVNLQGLPAGTTRVAFHFTMSLDL